MEPIVTNILSVRSRVHFLRHCAYIRALESLRTHFWLLLSQIWKTLIKVKIQCNPFHWVIYRLVHLFLILCIYLALFEKCSPRICIICPYRILHFIYCCLIGHLDIHILHIIHGVHLVYLWFLFVHIAYFSFILAIGDILTGLKITRHIHCLLNLLLIECNS